MKTKKLYKTLLIVLIGIIVLMGVLAMLFIAQQKAIKTIPNRAYTDPLSYYTISIPSNWTVEKETGQNTIGLNTQYPTKQKIEITLAHMSNQSGITIQVIEGVPACPLNENPNTSIDGYPANFDQVSQTWTIPTSKATMQINLSYPGLVPIDTQLNNSSKPLNPTQLNAIKQSLNTSIKSLRFTHVKPFTC